MAPWKTLGGQKKFMADANTFYQERYGHIDKAVAPRTTHQTERVKGSKLRPGNTIEVWWQPHRDTILSLEPYRGPLQHLFPEGAQLASFAIGPGMTIDNSDLYERIA